MPSEEIVDELEFKEAYRRLSYGRVLEKPVWDMDTLMVDLKDRAPA